MSRLGSHLAFSAQPRRHFFDKTGCGRYLRLFALGNVEPGAGECGLDFCSVHHAFSPLSGIGLVRYGKPTDQKGEPMNGLRSYSVRMEGAKYGVSFGSALAIAISYNTNHSILWAIIHGILSWLYVVYFALFYA
jgi:hypothetical protein